YFNSVNSSTGKNLNWFFNNWFFSNNYIDLAVAKVNSTGSKNSISIKNEGGFAIPFDVNVVYADGTKETAHKTPAVWANNQKTTTITLKGTKKIKSIALDGGLFMDATPADNIWTNK
ncbi:MAG: M1 family peptidase, partial [bacterium]|nr:M1 family peptidase [bacterium]